MSTLDALHFHDDDAARAYLEKVRWGDEPICPKCGSVGDHYRIEANAASKVRKGLLKCQDCRAQFSVTVGTVFERSKVPLHKWLLAAYLLCSSKKGFSSRQMQRTLGVTAQTAWFMTHRIRMAMSDPGTGGPFGSGGGVVEADETYFGRKPGRKMRAGAGHKETIFTLVERDGRAKSVHITGDTFKGIKKALKAVAPDARLATDDARIYRKIAKQFAEHLTVNHSAGEYRDGDACTNAIEGYFSVFKRGMEGVYQHCSSHHLHRYLSEFDFRHNHRAALGIDDTMRLIDVLGAIGGKRLLYRDPRSSHGECGTH